MTSPAAVVNRAGYHARSLVGRVMSVAAIGLAAVGVGWVIAIGHSDRLFDDWIVQNAVAAIGFGTIGLLVVPRQPRNGAVWAIIWGALATGTYCLGMALIYRGIDAAGITGDWLSLSPAEVPFQVSFPAMVTAWLYVPGIYLPLTLGFLLFPDGKLPGRRWEWARWAALAGIVFTSAILAHAFRPSSTLAYFNSVEVHPQEYSAAIGPFLSSVFWTLSYATLLPVLAGIAAMVVRYRRAGPAERRPFRVVLWGSAVLVGLLVPAVIVDGLGGTTTASRIGLIVGLAVFITAYGVALAKYRLYDFNIVVQRSVVFVVLATFIALTYATLSYGVGSLFGSDNVATLVATAVVAVAFEPVRRIAQRWANRVAYGERAAPYEVLDDLTGRLASSEDGEGVLRRMAQLLSDGTGATRTTIWLDEGSGIQPVATWPAEEEPGSVVDLTSDQVFPVRHGEEVVGALEVIKPRGTVLSSVETRLILDLAGSAGAVFGYQRLNDSLRARAHDLAESRTRLVEAQDVERRRLERDLHDGAQQMIVALRVKIGLARSMAAKQGATKLEQLLGGLSEEAQAALDEVRALARGIYPPVLESDGLGPAISGLASSAPGEIEVNGQGLRRYPREVEAAVYFQVSEAVTNAIKHASGPIRIDLEDAGSELLFSVVDNGPGFDVASANGGSGLQNMRDRIEAVGGELDIISGPGVGTKTQGRVPLGEAVV
jgi:signal transduction histidine kinase